MNIRTILLFITFVIFSINIFSQKKIIFSEVDKVIRERENEKLIETRVKERLKFRFSNSEDSLIYLNHNKSSERLKISRNGKKTQKWKYVFLESEKVTTINKGNCIKEINRPINCKGRPIGGRSVDYHCKKLDSLSFIVSNWMNNNYENKADIFYYEVKYDSLGAVSWKMEYMLSNEKKIISRKVIIPDKNFEITIYFDDNKNIVKREMITSKENYFNEYIYDDKNNMVEEKTYIDGELIKTIKMKYNIQNLPILEERSSKNSNKPTKYFYKYSFYK